MVEKAGAPEQADEEIKRQAAKRAGERARNARWDLNVAIFLFAVLIIVIILLSQGIGIEIVGPIALFGLAMVWLVGWRRGRQLYESFYQEELAGLERNLENKPKTIAKKLEETIEEKVQKALQERWR